MSIIRDRYQKVKTLAERGATEGERAAAQAAMKRMEAAHPELTEPTPQQPEPSVRGWRVVVVLYSSSATASNSTTSWF